MVQVQSEVTNEDGGNQTSRDIRNIEGLISFGLQKYDANSYDFVALMKDSFSAAFDFNGELNNLHQLLQSPKFPAEHKAFYDKTQLFGKGDRNSIFIKKFHEAWDSDPKWEELYHRFIRDVVQPVLCPGEKEIVVQKTPNIRIGIPGVSNIGRLPETDPSPDFIGLHCDGEHGHPPQEKNIIVPLTKMTSTNSLFFEPRPKSGLPCTHYELLETDPGKFFYFYGNGCKHFNKVNNTGMTRISFDFRIIPFSQYDAEYDSLSRTSSKLFRIGDYYSKISCS